VRIGYTCHDALPSTDTNTQQLFWTLYEIARAGWRIDLFTPAVRSAADPREAVASFYGAPGGVLPPGFTITPVGTTAPAGSPGRGWFDWRIASRLTKAFDLIWTRDPLAAVRHVRRGLPLIFETYRPDFASAWHLGPWRRAVLSHQNLAVIAHSRIAADAFVRAGLPASRCLVAHNGFAPCLMDPVLTREEARATLGLPRSGKLIVYAGHVGPSKGTASLLGLAALLKQGQVVILGTDERQVSRAGNLMYIPRVGVREVASYLYAADCLIVPPTGEPLRRYRRTVLPMKLFSYLAAGRPIVAPRLPDIEELLCDGETARLVPPDDLAAAAAALDDVLEDDRLQERLSANARTLAARFTWEARARNIVSFVDQWMSVGESRSAAAASASSR
jgi:glycosyltransferase involved in cell wall biosynthesis